MSKDFNELMTAAEDAFRKGNYRLATRRLRQAYEGSFWGAYRNPALLKMLAISLARRGRIHEAESVRSDLDDTAEELLDIDLAIGDAHMSRNECDKAEEKLESLTNRFPGEWKAWAAMGTAALKSSNFESAKSHFLKARSLGGANVEIEAGLAQCHERLGEYDEAIEAYLGTLPESPGYDSLSALKRIADNNRPTDIVNDLSQRIRKTTAPPHWVAWAQLISESHPATSRRIFRAVTNSLSDPRSRAGFSDYWWDFAQLAHDCRLTDKAFEFLFDIQSDLGLEALIWSLPDSDQKLDLLVRAAQCPWFSPRPYYLEWPELDAAVLDALASSIVGEIIASKNTGRSEQWAEYLIVNNHKEQARKLVPYFGNPDTLSYEALASRAKVFSELDRHDDAFSAANLCLQKLPASEDISTVYQILSDLFGKPEFASLENTHHAELFRIIRNRGKREETLMFAQLLSEFGKPEAAIELLSDLIATEVSVEDGCALLHRLFIEKTDEEEHLAASRFDQWKEIIQIDGSASWLVSTARATGRAQPDLARSFIEKAIDGLDETSGLWLDVAYACERTGDLENAYDAFTKAHYSPLGYRDYESWYQLAREIDSQSGARAILKTAISNWNLEDQVLVDWGLIRKAETELQSRISEIIEFAAEDLDTGSEINPLMLKLWANNRWTEVEHLLKQSIELEPNVALHRQRLNVALSNQARPEEAKAAAVAADSLENPTAFGSWRTASSLLELDCIQEAIERLKEAEGLPHSNPEERILTLDLLALAESLAGNFYDARSHAQSGLSLALDVLKAHPEKAQNESLSIWPRFRLAYVLNEMGAQEEAIEQYTELEPSSHPYPVHNIASILESRACFSEARLVWKKALKFYLKDLDDRLETRDSEYLFNFSIALRAYGRPALGIDLCRIGLFYSPNNPLGLSCLLEACVKLAGTTEDPEEASQARRMASNAYNQLRNSCGDDSPGGSTYTNLLRLGVGALNMDDLEIAIEKLKLAVAKRHYEENGRKALIMALVKAKQPNQAISHGKALLASRTDDLETMISLGRAYLEKSDLDNAEHYFSRVLQFAHRHYDAKMGMGELYLALAEKQPKNSEKQTLIDFYQRAAAAFTEALDIAKSDDRAKDYTKNELAEAHYLQGYALVGQYEATPIKTGVAGLGLLREAQKAFVKAYELDSDHHKAKRAEMRIREKTNWLSSETVTQRWAPMFVCLLSVLVLGIITYNYIWGQAKHQPASYELTQNTMEQLAGGIGELSEPQQASLKLLQDKVFSSADDLLSTIEKITGPAWAKTHSLELTTAAYVPAPPETRKYLEVGYFVAAAFGTLIFFIAGLYLPQLTNLKIGGIQLEKSSAQQTVTGSFGITR